MEKKFFTGMAVLLLGASLFFLGCGGDDDGSDGSNSGSEPSGNAALETASAVVKGVAVVFGTGTGDAFATPVQGTVAAAKSALDSTGTTPATTFTAAESGSSKVVRVAAADVAGYTETAFGTDDAYANAALAAGDVLFVRVTSESGSTVKWYKITVLEDVKSVYSLKTTEGAAAQPDTASGLEILSAVKDAAGVTIRLGGTLAESFVYTAAGNVEYPATDPAVDFPARSFWMGEGDKVTSAAGKYSNVYIHGLFSDLATGHAKVIAIKQTNQALRFFSGDNTTSAAVTVPKAADENATYIPTPGAPIRWRVYGSGVINSAEPFGILLYDDGTNTQTQTAVLELTERVGATDGATATSGGYTATITVDYSAVNFGNTEAVANVYSLKVSEENTTADTASGLEILSASKDAAGTVTIKLGGTLAADYVYTADGSTKHVQGTSADPAHFSTGFWMGAGDTVTSAAGKYSNVFIQGLFSGLPATGHTKYVAVKQTNQALRFFKDGKDSEGAASPGITATVLQGPKAADAEGATYIPAATGDSPVRWRVYASGAKTHDETFGVLIYAGALTPKTATFDLTERTGHTANAPEVTANDRYTATIIVDYSAVNFGS
jgi:hypothetical protein